MLALLLLPCPPAAVNMVDDCGGVKLQAPWEPHWNQVGNSGKAVGIRKRLTIFPDASST
jgi:hypothetical protein